ncbi:MAG: T9SS type A sorting domain-containing protein [Flavobacteriaceae bacterium]|nr:T9SS type A sorting domain-containing protein [Flavobacteriaceae bacterium]
MGGYADYTSQTTDVIAGNSYSLSVNLNTDGNYMVGAMAWFDWNQDGDFDDPKEDFDLGTTWRSSDGKTTKSALNIPIPTTALAGNTRMRISAKWNNSPTSCETGFDGEVEDYTINIIASRTITTGAISPTSYCVGASVNIPYTITGTFNNGNIFTAQLSDASGSFASPVTIGTLTSTAAGSITGTIPNNTIAGTGYRIRVVSSNPVVTGSVNTSNLTVNVVPSAPIVGAITQPTCATATGSVILNGLPSGSWELTRSPGGLVTTGTGTSTTISGLSPGTFTYSVISSNNGTGLKGEYFNNMTLSGTPALTRTDASVNFDWVNGGPGAPIGNDNFSVRWSGQIQPLYSQNYTFTTTSDDGIRLWVNGVQIINNWTDHAVTNNTGTINLVAGIKYDIVLEYYENGGQAVSKLSWNSASQALQIVPPLQLYPSAVCSSSASANVVINAQPSNNIWNGSVSTDWNTPGNWCTGVPSVTNNLDVVIPSALTTTYSPTLNTGSFGYVENILFDSGSILTVDDNYLFVKKNLTLNGKIDLNNEAQLVQSTDIASTFDAASTGSIEIDQQGTSDNFKYNYWGSPVNTTGTAYTIAGVLRDGTDPNAFPLTPITFGTPYAFADGAVTIPIRLSTYWMYKYANLGIGYSGWTSVGKDGTLKIGEGFTMKGSNSNLTEQNYTFVGKPNNGDINLTISANNDYLIGNPYPSALDAKQFIRDNIKQVVVTNPTDPTETGAGDRLTNIIDGNLYFWDHFGGGNHLLKSYEGGYAIFNLSGSVLAVSNDILTKNTGATSNSGKVPQRFIPVAQGFFVTSLASGQIQFKNSQRIFKKENAGVSQFMKSAKTSNAGKETDTDEDTFPRIHLNYSSPKGYQRQLLVAFIENTTDGVDIGYDAINYETFAEDMSWRTNNINFIIQAVPTLNDERILPLEVKVATAGIIKISLDNAENIPADTEIFIKDFTTGKMHNISKAPFEIELTAGKYADRFAITFKTQKLMAEDVKAEVLIPADLQPILEGIHVFMNNAMKELQIKNNSTEEITSVALRNSLGQTVRTWNSNFNRRTISLPVNTATGVYVVQIITKNGLVVQKVIVE